MLTFAADHPTLAVVLVLSCGLAVRWCVAAAVAPLTSWRRPGDCPRCRGTGREPS